MFVGYLFWVTFGVFVCFRFSCLCGLGLVVLNLHFLFGGRGMVWSVYTGSCFWIYFGGRCFLFDCRVGCMWVFYFGESV